MKRECSLVSWCNICNVDKSPNALDSVRKLEKEKYGFVEFGIYHSYIWTLKRL